MPAAPKTGSLRRLPSHPAPGSTFGGVGTDTDMPSRLNRLLADSIGAVIGRLRTVRWARPKDWECSYPRHRSISLPNSGAPAMVRSRCEPDGCMTSFVTRNSVDWRGPSVLERASAQVTLSRDGQRCREDRSSYPPAAGASLRPVDGCKGAQDRSHRSGGLDGGSAGRRRVRPPDPHPATS